MRQIIKTLVKHIKKLKLFTWTLKVGKMDWKNVRSLSDAVAEAAPSALLDDL